VATLLELQVHLGRLAVILWNYGAEFSQPILDPYEDGSYGFEFEAALPGSAVGKPATIKMAETWEPARNGTYVICRDPALAEDAAQGAWAIAWRRMGDVKDPTHVRGWLVAVAANEARRTMRSRRPIIREISVGDIELEGVPDVRSDPLADTIARSDLRRVLASLDPTDRALIALRYVAELSSDEIGRALGMSSSGARGRLSRLLLRLRGELRDA
jgi:RNA polymerase sigma-70 factor (ECF subfamily)